VSRIVFFVAL
jgi:hypothetical protein